MSTCRAAGKLLVVWTHSTSCTAGSGGAALRTGGEASSSPPPHSPGPARHCLRPPNRPAEADTRTGASAWLQPQLGEAERALAQALTCCVTLGK